MKGETMNYGRLDAQRRGALARAVNAKLLQCMIIAAAAASLPGPVRAEDTSAIAEIIVTAQKIQEPLSKVPVTISALTGAQLVERNYLSLEDFKGSVPGLQVNNYVGEARINIRGIGMNSLSFGVDSQVALNMNGVYVANAFGADQRFLDIDRIEVLRGPQGTLYGRNATGGAINVITRRPTEQFEGYAQLRFGNYNDINTQFVVSGPLAGDRILGRLAASTEDHDGYSRNLFDGKHYDDAQSRAVRGTLQFNFTDAVSLDLVGDYSRGDDGSAATHLFGQSPGFPMTGLLMGYDSVPLDGNGEAIDPRLLSINTIPDYYQYSGGAAADLNWKINETYSARSLTSFRKSHSTFTIDFDQTTAPFPSGVGTKDFEGDTGHEQFSQEFQFAGKFDRVNFVAGLYYFHDETDPAVVRLGINVAPPSPTPFIVHLQLGGTTITNAFAVFGQATAKITDKLNFTAGLRYSDERKSSTVRQIIPEFALDVPDSAATDFTDTSPKFTVDYQWTDTFMTYATAAKGFKSGGFDITASPPLVAFKPETIWDYEIGAKLRTGWGTVDLAAFHYDYTDLQLAQIVNGLPATSNAGSSDGNGVELAFAIEPISPLTITAALAYLDATFNDVTENDTLTGQPVSLEGNQLPGASKYSSNLTAEYRIPIGQGELSLYGEWNWRDRLYFTEFNSEQVSQEAVSTLNAAARYTAGGGKWYAEVYGKNLSDELTWSQKWITGAGYGSPVIGNLDPPRTYGLTVHYNF